MAKTEQEVINQICQLLNDTAVRAYLSRFGPHSTVAELERLDQFLMRSIDGKTDVSRSERINGLAESLKANA